MFTVVVPEDQDRLARSITVLFEDRDGAIWCGSHKGLLRLELTGGRLELRPVDIKMPATYANQGHVQDLLEDRHGSLWVATGVGLYRRWPDGSAARYTTSDGLPDNNIHDLLEDHQGQLWATTREAGFFRFVADHSHASPVVAETHVCTVNGKPIPWVFQLFETSDRRFWVATNAGISEFFPGRDADGSEFHSFSKENGLSFREITALNEDMGGNLWLGTNTMGAMKLARNGFITSHIHQFHDRTLSRRHRQAMRCSG